ncbi:hypothetical protein Tco_0786308 [Tanacetum coccineum]
MSQTEGMVTKLKNQLAAQGGQFQSMSTQLTPPNVFSVDINPINSNADEEGGTTVVGCKNDASIQKSNGLTTLEKEMCRILVAGEERIKAAFEEFKRLEDEKVEQRCAEMDARLDALSIDFDEELYPHMLTTDIVILSHIPPLEIINQAQSLRHLLESGTSTTILNSLHKTVINKAVDEYGFVIRPGLVGETFGSVRIDL